MDLDGNKTVVASWNYNSIQTESFAFDIEHSLHAPKEGDLLSELPYLPFKSDFEERSDAQVRHDEPTEGVMHYYRIIGRDGFGIPSLYSEWKSIYVPKRIYATVTIDSIKAYEFDRDVYISIAVTKKHSNIEEVRLLRSTNKDNGFALMANMPFKDSVLVMRTKSERKTGDHYYYKAELVSKDDSIQSRPHYFFTLDQEPPSPPSEINITIDSNGIANLNWRAPSDMDIRGYRVFRANHSDEEFIEVTNRLTHSPSFSDTLRLDNLTHEVYYYVRSVDSNYNNSQHSDTILAFKPDTIAPIPCILKAVSPFEKGLNISWVPSNSNDVESTILFRNGLAIGSFDGTYQDSLLDFGKQYSYRLKTIDISGNESFSNEITYFFEPGYRPPLRVKGSVNVADKHIYLEWKLPDDEVYSIEVFRALKGEPMRYYETIHATTTFFKDAQVRIGETYVYSVKYITKDGIHSIPVEVEVAY